MFKVERKLQVKSVIIDIALWLKEYADTNKIKSLVVGVSGGIDSALVSTLCVMSGIKTYCIVLPLHQKPEQTERGEKHIEWLMKKSYNMEMIKVDLSETFDTFKYAIPSNTLNELALVNTRSRLRMTTLYQIAQAKGGIVVGTGNKVEDLGIGFFTKYGDGGVDIAPIADLYKSEVYAMAKELNVIEEIQTARPTDGLWDNDRDDETQIGATYDELEWVMEYLDTTPHDLVTLNLTDREREVLKIYLSFNKRNKHKMVDIPIFKI